MNSTGDHYGILGVLPSAEIDVIKVAYQALVKKFRRDRGVFSRYETQTKLKRLSEAYKVLSDPARRRDYDSSRNTIGCGHVQFDLDTSINSTEFFNIKDDDTWGAAIDLYPDAEFGFERLERISPSLAIAYRIVLIKTRGFDIAQELEANLLNEFLQRFFGNSREVQEFGKWCLQSYHRDIATELNKIVTILGPTANAKRIVSKLKSRY